MKKKIIKQITDKLMFNGWFILLLSIFFYFISKLILGFDFGVSYKGNDINTFFIIISYVILFVLSIALLVGWKIRNSEYFNTLQYLLFSLSFVVALLMLLLSVNNHIYTFFMLVIYLNLVYLLTRKNWYPYVLLFVGFLLLIPVLFFWWLHIVTLAASEGAYMAMQQMDDFSETKLEYALDAIPLILIPTTYILLLLTLGFVKLRNKKGVWEKLLKYEAGLMIMLISIQLGRWWLK